MSLSDEYRELMQNAYDALAAFLNASDHRSRRTSSRSR